MPTRLKYSNAVYTHWGDKIYKYLQAGATQADIAKREKVSRERARQLIHQCGYYADWKLVKTQRKKKCKICGAFISKCRTYCTVCSPYKKTGHYRCSMCGKKTKKGKRAKGMCMSCYRDTWKGKQ